MKEFSIGRVKFTGDRTVVIAEAGVNHIGQLEIAEELIAAASRAGADIVKFQTYKAEKLATKEAERFWKWEGELDSSGSQFDSYSNLDSFGVEEYRKLVDLCEKHEVEFMSTPFDTESVEMLDSLGMAGYKVASCDITNQPLLACIGRTGKPVLLSTGASTVDEVIKAVETLESNGSGQVAIMHCTLTYPTPVEDVNLGAIADLSESFPDYLVGLSDHTLGIEVPPLAVAVGARLLEKHFTIDKSLPLSADHWLSVDEAELSQMVARIRHVEMLLGSGEKTVLESEKLARRNARRSLVASRPLSAGTVLSSADFLPKRPGTGLNPFMLSELVGKTLKHSVEADHLFSLQDFTD